MPSKGLPARSRNKVARKSAMGSQNLVVKYSVGIRCDLRQRAPPGRPAGHRAALIHWLAVLAIRTLVKNTTEGAHTYASLTAMALRSWLSPHVLSTARHGMVCIPQSRARPRMKSIVEMRRRYIPVARISISGYLTRERGTTYA